jgi:hypothetical protein
VIKTLRISVYFYSSLSMDVRDEVMSLMPVCMSLRGAQATCLHTEVLCFSTQAWQSITLPQLSRNNEVSINFHFCTIINTFQEDGNTLLPIQFTFKNTAESLERTVFNEDLFSLAYFWFLN